MPPANPVGAGYSARGQARGRDHAAADRPRNSNLAQRNYAKVQTRVVEMFSLRSRVLVVVLGIVACDPERDDVGRIADDVDLEAADQDDEDEDESVDDRSVSEPPAPERDDPSGGAEDSQASVPLATEVDPTEKPKWECDWSGDTWVCCSMSGLPTCCWWNGSSYDC